MYTLEFQQRPPWRAIFLDQPQFTGMPVPSFYQGKSIAELLTNAPPVTNTVSLAPSACTNLDASPELRRHPTLDQLVTDMRRDPLALANFVHNEIELTDALAYNDNGSISDISINLGGVRRSALATLMERQGSPTEQCDLPASSGGHSRHVCLSPGEQHEDARYTIEQTVEDADSRGDK